MIRVFEAFAGIGTQRMALRNLRIDHEVVAIAEIDKFAIKSYEAIHGEVNNLGDISKVQADDIPDHDLFTYSFPCQDISIAGKQGGFDKDSGTRSSLLWECNRVIEHKKPKYLMLENVKNLVGKKFKPSFDEWLEHLESLGYTNYWQVLNAKDYGVPQNRERVFVISILGEHEPYVFPEKFELTSRLKDVLEDEVDEKFYLSDEKTEKLTLNMERKSSPGSISVLGNTSNTGYRAENIYSVDGSSPTLLSRDYKGAKQILEPKVIDDQGRTKKKLKLKDYSPTLRAQSHGNEPKVVEGIPIKNATKKGYLMATDGDGVDLAYPESETRRGRVQKERSQTVTTSDNLGVVQYNRKDGIGKQIKVAHTLNSTDWRGLNRNQTQNAVIAASRGRNPDNPSDRTTGAPTEQRLEINKQGTSNTITTVQKDNYVVEPFRIRKLTPKECWRLMGCSDEDFHKAEAVNSNTQLCKQAGNAIVVDVLEQLFGQLYR